MCCFTEFVLGAWASRKPFSLYVGLSCRRPLVFGRCLSVLLTGGHEDGLMFSPSFPNRFPPSWLYTIPWSLRLFSVSPFVFSLGLPLVPVAGWTNPTSGVPFFFGLFPGLFLTLLRSLLGCPTPPPPRDNLFSPPIAVSRWRLLWVFLFFRLRIPNVVSTRAYLQFAHSRTCPLSSIPL